MARFFEVSDRGTLAADDSWLFANTNAEDEAARNFRRSIFMIDDFNISVYVGKSRQPGTLGM